VSSNFSPKKPAGFKSPEPALDSNEVAHLIAGGLETILGVIGFFVSLLMLSSTIFTVILSGVSMVMVTKGAYNCWNVSRYEPKLTLIAKIFVFGGPLSLLGILVLLAIYGPGAWPLAGFAPQAPMP